jgi:hypothetical protein
MDRGLMELLTSRTQVTPGPLTLVARYLVKSNPAAAAAFAQRALEVDPWWGPALNCQVDALRAEGKQDEARAAAGLRDERFRQGAWQVYD